MRGRRHGKLVQSDALFVSKKLLILASHSQFSIDLCPCSTNSVNVSLLITSTVQGCLEDQLATDLAGSSSVMQGTHSQRCNSHARRCRYFIICCGTLSRSLS